MAGMTKKVTERRERSAPKLSIKRMESLHLLPTPESPHPAAKADAVPMTCLSNQAAIKHWQGTKAAPAIPGRRRERAAISFIQSNHCQKRVVEPTHEEPDEVETSDTHSGTSETARQSREPKSCDENVALHGENRQLRSLRPGDRSPGESVKTHRSESITQRTSHETNEQRSNTRDNIAVRDFSVREVHVSLDGDVE